MRLVTFRARQEEMVGRLEEDRVVALQAPSMLDWLRGDGRDEAGAEHALADIELLAPVPDPPSVRDFFAFEEHVATGWRLNPTCSSSIQSRKPARLSASRGGVD